VWREPHSFAPGHHHHELVAGCLPLSAYSKLLAAAMELIFDTNASVAVLAAIVASLPVKFTRTPGAAIELKQADGYGHCGARVFCIPLDISDESCASADCLCANRTMHRISCPPFAAELR
jgi:hypothetical protein